MIQNALRAARLDIDFYNEAERNTSLTGQAFVVVVVAYALSGVGAWIGPADDLLGAVVGSVVWGIIGWIVWAFITNLIGGALGGTANFGEMLRVLGFAQVPIAIGIIPFLDWVGLIWMFIAAVIAVREGLDFSTLKAIGTLILGWLVIAVGRAVINFLF